MPQNGAKVDNRSAQTLKGSREGKPPQKTIYHIILFGHGIYRELAKDLQHKLDEIVKTPPPATEIDLWLESPGGDAHAAYKIVLELRSRASRIRTVIPDVAKSAASLIAIGTDEIMMGRSAELGPLDVQVCHPDREEVTVSGIDVARALEFVTQTAVGFVCRGGASIVSCTSLSRKDVLHETCLLAAQLFAPVVGKVDPHLVHQARNQLRVAKHYALNMLDNRHVKEEFRLSHQAASELLTHLVDHYPDHGYVIDRSEALSLGLPVTNAEEHPRWNSINNIFRKLYIDEEKLCAVYSDDFFDSGSPRGIRKSNAAPKKKLPRSASGNARVQLAESR